MTSTATWVETFTGKHVDILDPDPDEICIEDLAHALANTNRFGGHTSEPYSVAEHCVRMSEICPHGLALECLMHDAAEAYIGDMPSPFKQVMPDFQVFEARLERAIRIRFNLPGDHHPEAVRHYDQVMLLTEARELGLSWWKTGKHTNMPEPLVGELIPWDWKTAKSRFLKRFEELTR